MSYSVFLESYHCIYPGCHNKFTQNSYGNKRRYCHACILKKKNARALKVYYDKKERKMLEWIPKQLMNKLPDLEKI